ncbi:MAG: PH domain-containing protein [Gammaproteobacteria bacterium]|nr:PH domain-containing protein [Gammaproteobacteria bacterium]
MQASIITNSDGLPFDEAGAHHMATVLSCETGRHYRAIPWQTGFGVEAFSGSPASHEQDFAELSLHPAIRSQCLPLMFVVLCFLASQSMESILLALGLDHLRVFLYEFLGKTFAWEPVILLFGRLALLMGLLILVRIIYAWYSRTYFIGPRGVEATLGIIAKDQTRIEFKHIRGVKLRQGILERLIGVGTIEIATSGSEGSEIRFMAIARPHKILAVLRERAKVLA